jgi:hypothetical protein
MASEAIVIPEAIGRKYERDIDMLLAEEFATSPRFTNWFLGKTKKFKSLEGIVSEVYISKSDSMGESDLIVILLKTRSMHHSNLNKKNAIKFEPKKEHRKGNTPISKLFSALLRCTLPLLPVLNYSTH